MSEKREEEEGKASKHMHEDHDEVSVTINSFQDLIFA
jgi:hypothetical protein